MKKYLLTLGIILASIFFSGVVYADGGFLDINIMIANDHGGTLQPYDVSYNVNYDNQSVSMSGPLGQEGYPQAFGFPSHSGNQPLTYSITTNPIEGYVFTESGQCSGTLPAGSLKIINCTIYVNDSGYPLPVISQPTAMVQTPSTQTVSTSTDTDSNVQDLQNTLIALMKTVIQLLNQLIALKTNN